MRKLLLGIFLAVLPAMAADVYSFSVLGPETVSGPSGTPTLTGWGYSIQNQSSADWLVTTNLNAGLFLHATPQALFDFPDVAPGATVTVLYDPVAPAGLYQIVWDQDAPAGFVNSGTFSLDAQWWSGDPLGNGQFIASAPTASQPYSTATAAAPEPASASLIALSILLTGAVTVFRRKTISRSTARG